MKSLPNVTMMGSLLIILIVHDTTSNSLTPPATLLQNPAGNNKSGESQGDRLLVKRGLLYNDMSSRGYYCMGSCQKIGTSYFWCRVNGGDIPWDYCSPYTGVDYYGQKCKSGCDYRGEKYRWCYLEQGSWGYCSGYGSAPRLSSHNYSLALLMSYLLSFCIQFSKFCD